MTDLTSLTQGELSAVLGISTRQIRKLHRGDRGIPHFRDGREVRYPIPAAVEFYFRSRDGKEDPRDRLVAAQASLKEHELQRIRGEWLHISDTVRLHEDALSALRARLLALPGRIAAELPLPAVEAVEIIEPIVHEFMAELAAGDEEGMDGEELEEESDPS